MIEVHGPSAVLECFCAVEFAGDGTARVGICALGYQGRIRTHDVRRCLAILSCAGRIEIAVARAIAWAMQGAVWEAVIVHVGGEWLARQIELAVDGGGDDLAAAWLSTLKGRCSVAADRIERPTTPRMREAASLAHRGRIDETIEAAIEIE